MRDKIKEELQNHFPDMPIEEIENATPFTLKIAESDLKKVSHFLQTHDSCYFDLLSSITGVDNGVEQGTIDVIYHLYSIPFEYALALKVVLDRNCAEIASLSDIWKAAEWHERETYDLLGVVFLNHPDLRRILLPADWEGHPLRKDYKAQEIYHGVKVKY